MIRATILSLAAATGLVLGSGTANAQVYVSPGYNPYAGLGVVPSGYVAPAVVVPPVGGYSVIVPPTMIHPPVYYGPAVYPTYRYGGFGYNYGYYRGPGVGFRAGGFRAGYRW